MASGPEVPVASAASHWGSEKSMLLMRKMLCRSKPKDHQIVSVPHEHHDEYDDDDLPNLCQHYWGRATVGQVWAAFEVSVGIRCRRSDGACFQARGRHRACCIHNLFYGSP